jgi:hypothetical protein
MTIIAIWTLNRDSDVTCVANGYAESLCRWFTCLADPLSREISVVSGLNINRTMPLVSQVPENHTNKKGDFTVMHYTVYTAEYRNLGR